MAQAAGQQAVMVTLTEEEQQQAAAKERRRIANRLAKQRQRERDNLQATLNLAGRQSAEDMVWEMMVIMISINLF